MLSTKGSPSRLRGGLVKEINSRLFAGEDPNAEKRAAREAPILSQLWDRYLKTYAQPHKKASSVAEDSRNYKNHLEPWGANRQLASITQSDVKHLHTRIGEHSGKYAANRVLSLLAAMFSKSGKDLIFDPRDNPCRGVPKFPEKARDRVLYADELRRFLAAVAMEKDTDIRDFLMIALYTGARRANVLSMAWDDLDLRSSTWTVPGATTKNGDPMVITLAPPVLAILKARPHMTSFVFPAKLVSQAQVEQARALAKGNATTRDIARMLDLSQTQVCRMFRPNFNAGAPRPMSPLKKEVWTRIQATAEIKQRITLHDLRRTFATWLVKSGASLTVVAAAMGHKDLRTTQRVYVWADAELVKKATLAGVAAIGEATTRK